MDSVSEISSSSHMQKSEQTDLTCVCLSMEKNERYKCPMTLWERIPGKSRRLRSQANMRLRSVAHSQQREAGQEVCSRIGIMKRRDSRSVDNLNIP